MDTPLTRKKGKLIAKNVPNLTAVRDQTLSNTECGRDSHNTILMTILIEEFMLSYGLTCKYDISHRRRERPKVAYQVR
jgi:hypothetical protein